MNRSYENAVLGITKTLDGSKLITNQWKHNNNDRQYFVKTGLFIYNKPQVESFRIKKFFYVDIIQTETFTISVELLRPI